jgi:hypothetical protein
MLKEREKILLEGVHGNGRHALGVKRMKLFQQAAV